MKGSRPTLVKSCRRVAEIACTVEEIKLAVRVDLAELQADDAIEEDLLVPKLGNLIEVASGSDVGKALRVADVVAAAAAIGRVVIDED